MGSRTRHCYRSPVKTVRTKLVYHIDPQVVYPLPGRNLVRMISTRTRPALSKFVVRQVPRNNRLPPSSRILDHPLLLISVGREKNEFDVEVALSEWRVKDYLSSAGHKGKNINRYRRPSRLGGLLEDSDILGWLSSAAARCP